MSIVDQFVLFAAILVLGTTAIMDLRERRIPNGLVLTLAALALAHIALSRDAGAAVNDIKWAGLVLIGALGFWILKWFGGGDAKLMFAASLLVGARVLPEFLVLTAFLGGALGALTFADMWLEKYYGWSTGLAHPLANVTIFVPRQATVPYGIAICLAGVATLFATSSAYW
jgi:prepilin peptidase CpaA